jgi:uncharacterized glyoxalase superfamily protein PhnB
MTTGKDYVDTEQFRLLIRAKDYQSTLDFWEGSLGLERVSGWEREDSSGAVLGTGGNAVVIIIGGGATNYDFPPQDGVYAGIKVDDVDDWHERLKDTAVEIEGPPNNKMWGLRTLSLRDPNGFRVYLFTDQAQPND